MLRIRDPALPEVYPEQRHLNYLALICFTLAGAHYKASYFMRSHSKYCANIGIYLDYALARQYFHITSEQEITPDSGMHSIFVNICWEGEGEWGSGSCNCNSRNTFWLSAQLHSRVICHLALCLAHTRTSPAGLVGWWAWLAKDVAVTDSPLSRRLAASKQINKQENQQQKNERTCRRVFSRRLKSLI